MLEIQVIATLAPPIFYQRACSAIFWTVKIVKIGQELAKWRGFPFQKHAILATFAHFLAIFGTFRSTSFFRIAIVGRVFGLYVKGTFRSLGISKGLLRM